MRKWSVLSIYYKEKRYTKLYNEGCHSCPLKKISVCLKIIGKVTIKITGTKLIMSYVVVLQMVFVPNLIHEYTLNQILNNQPRIRNTVKGTAIPK